MKINIENLDINNIKNLNYNLELSKSTVITGWSGSGKSSFANALYQEAKRKFILLLPKSEYSFIFKNEEFKSTTNSLSFFNTPFIISIENKVTSNTPKSTIGTHTGILKSIRKEFAKQHHMSSEFFSFNIPISWCTKCKGKGTFRGDLCISCKGTRYLKNIEQYKISCSKFGNLNIIEILSLPLNDILSISKDLNLTKKNILKLENSKKLNINYLSLDRSIITLSGGEYARLILVNYLGLSENIVYIIDEPSVGLDSENIRNMITVLNELGEKNQIFIIEHNRIMRESTQNTIMFGKKSGKEGGKIISTIKVDNCKLLDKIICSKYLEILDLQNRNINLKKLSLPLNSFSVITGESGVGKTSLLQVLIPKIEKEQNFEVIHIEQNKLRGITSKSTIATYLGFMETLKKYTKLKIDNCNICNGSGLDIDNISCLNCNGSGLDNSFLKSKVKNIKIEQILNSSISDIFNNLPIQLQTKSIKLLMELSNGYLSLNRQVNSLSGGEFQRLYLAKQLSLIFNSNSKKNYIIFLDEPSKGLSQNYSNELILLLKNVIKNNSNITLIAIEHNECVINNADYIADMGKRRTSINNIIFTKIENNTKSNNEKIIFTSSLKRSESNISFIEAKKQYKSLLKIYSKTAEWIYSDIDYTDNLNPVIAIDFEKDNLYSKNTRMYEVLNIYPQILKKIENNNSIFNLTDKSNICKTCKGHGKINTLDFNKIFINQSKSLLKGLVDKELITIIRPYNLDKIKFLFQAINNEFNFDLNKPYDKMNEEEKNILKYGFLNKRFIFKFKGSSTYQTWQGLNHLIIKYLRTYKKNQMLKEKIKSTISLISCPKCNGEIFNHSLDTTIEGNSLRDYLKLDAKLILKEVLDKDIFKLLNDEISNSKLNDDVSLFDKKTQSSLKLLEIIAYSIQNYQIHIKNISDFLSQENEVFSIIANKNSLYLHDDFSIKKNKKELLSKLKKDSKLKLTSTSMVYELFGVEKKELKKKITLLKKSNPCKSCMGKGNFVIENPIEGLDVERIECSYCFGSGIDVKSLFTTKIVDFSIYDIYTSSKLKIKLNQTISSLEKEELFMLINNI